MKWIVSILFLLSFVSLSYSSASESTVRFNNPKASGIALDWCKTWGSGCGKPAADYFCRYKGYGKSKFFKKEIDLGYTKILKTGQICNSKFCDSFKFITCKKKITYKRFSYPKYNNVALDWCYTWGSKCGKKTATEYCKAKGYPKGAYRFRIDNDVGYTIIMRTGQFCNAKFCDSFKYIDCKK